MTRGPNRCTAPPNRQPGDFVARVVAEDGATVHLSSEEFMGYRSFEDVARDIALNTLCMDGSVATVDVEDHTGKTRRFKVQMKIKATGIVTEEPR